MAFSKLGYVPAAEFVYRWEMFGLSGHDIYIFKKLLGTIRGANPDFRKTLAEVALQKISNPSGAAEHLKAVAVLSSLGDDRLVAHLEGRLAENGLLGRYENHALIALGTDAAGALFARSVMAVGARLAGLPNDHANHDARNRLISLVRSNTYDTRYLLTPAFEPHLKALIKADNPDVSWLASALAKRGLMASLLYSAVVVGDPPGELDLHRNQQRACVTTDVWLGWWRQSTDSGLRRRLLGLLPLCPSAEVEKILIECLDSAELRGSAARELGDYGVVRSAADLRGILAEEITAGDHWGRYGAVRALGALRDEAAVPLLEKTAAEYPLDWIVGEAVSSLGLIGTPAAECALDRLLQCGKAGEFEEMVLEALLYCGSAPAVSIVVNRARSRMDGPRWLCDRLVGLSDFRGWSQGEYYTDIYTDELVDYLTSHYQTGSPGQDWKLGEAFRQIDSPAVRTLLRKWADRRGSPQDSLMRENGRRRISDVCLEELRDRGDESAIDFTLDGRAEDKDNIYVLATADLLRTFPATAVAERLRLRLAAATTTSQVVRMLCLLGRFGEAADVDRANRFLDHPDDLVASVACTTVLRLSDPMLLPDRW